MCVFVGTEGEPMSADTSSACSSWPWFWAPQWRTTTGFPESRSNCWRSAASHFCNRYLDWAAEPRAAMVSGRHILDHPATFNTANLHPLRGQWLATIHAFIKHEGISTSYVFVIVIYPKRSYVCAVRFAWYTEVWLHQRYLNCQLVNLRLTLSGY